MVTNISGDPINSRTMEMLTEAEAISGVHLTILQGKNPGGVAASAGTHDGWGVVDIRTRDFDVATRAAVLRAVRTVGFAGWLRTIAQGFTAPHLHAVAIGDPGISPGASRQVTAYKNGKNGLANNGPDDGPDGFRNVTWESYLERVGITMAAKDEILAAINLLSKKLDAIIVDDKTDDTTATGRFAQDIGEGRGQEQRITAKVDALAQKVDQLLAKP